MWGCSSAGRAPALQAGGHRFDPGQLHHASTLLLVDDKHTDELIRPDAEVRFVLFENLGRNKRFGSVEPNVSLRQVGEVLDQYSEATWSYMVKRISAYGGCLGGQRR